GELLQFRVHAGDDPDVAVQGADGHVAVGQEIDARDEEQRLVRVVVGHRQRVDDVRGVVRADLAPGDEGPPAGRAGLGPRGGVGGAGSAGAALPWSGLSTGVRSSFSPCHWSTWNRRGAELAGTLTSTRGPRSSSAPSPRSATTSQVPNACRTATGTPSTVVVVAPEPGSSAASIASERSAGPTCRARVNSTVPSSSGTAPGASSTSAAPTV